jgi:hypothetical protein
MPSSSGSVISISRSPRSSIITLVVDAGSPAMTLATPNQPFDQPPRCSLAESVGVAGHGGGADQPFIAGRREHYLAAIRAQIVCGVISKAFHLQPEALEIGALLFGPRLIDLAALADGAVIAPLARRLVECRVRIDPAARGAAPTIASHQFVPVINVGICDSNFSPRAKATKILPIEIALSRKLNGLMG